MARILVLGSNRGIGLELCRQLVERGETMHAACRKSSPELVEVAPAQIHEGIEITDDTCLEKLRNDLGSKVLDGLIVVSGILERVSLDSFAKESIRRQFEVNALGPLSVVVHLLPALKSGAKIGLLTSRMGSIADNDSGGSYGYRMSKAALNMAAKSLAIDLRPQKIAIGLWHPGWVQTEMTGGTGHLTAEQSAQGLITLFDRLNLEASGRFLHQNGQELPW